MWMMQFLKKYDFEKWKELELCANDMLVLLQNFTRMLKANVDVFVDYW